MLKIDKWKKANAILLTGVLESIEILDSAKVITQENAKALIVLQKILNENTEYIIKEILPQKK